MSVFISYNHEDREFADRLALELVRHDIKVWKDSWRVGVGDSLIQKVQDGLEGARFFCIIFSKNSLNSEWVRREITAALLREIEDRKVMILPILIDDVKLPLLIRDKLYADFRDDFQSGLSKLLAVLSPYYRTQSLGRASPHDKYYIDFAYNTEIVDNRPVCEIDVISFDLEEPYSIFTNIRFEGTEDTTLRRLGVPSVSGITDIIFDACIEEFSKSPGRVALSPGTKFEAQFTLHDENGLVLFNAFTTVKILGNMHKGAVVFNLGALFSQIDDSRQRS
jgi:hypothetical protein